MRIKVKVEELGHSLAVRVPGRNEVTLEYTHTNVHDRDRACYICKEPMRLEPGWRVLFSDTCYHEKCIEVDRRGLQRDHKH